MWLSSVVESKLLSPTSQDFLALCWKIKWSESCIIDRRWENIQSIGSIFDHLTLASVSLCYCRPLCFGRTTTDSHTQTCLVSIVSFLVPPYCQCVTEKHCYMWSAKCSNTKNSSWLPLQLCWWIIKANVRERWTPCYTPGWKYTQHIIQLSISHRYIFWSSEHNDVSYHWKV
mgnify:CR=1 FL=1